MARRALALVALLGVLGSAACSRDAARTARRERACAAIGAQPSPPPVADAWASVHCLDGTEHLCDEAADAARRTTRRIGGARTMSDDEIAEAGLAFARDLAATTEGDLRALARSVADDLEASIDGPALPADRARDLVARVDRILALIGDRCGLELPHVVVDVTER